MDPLPRSCHRLFAHYQDLDRKVDENTDFVIGRLLEEGTSDDLRWLTATFSEEVLAHWLARRGHRQLSRRSLHFWELTLQTMSPEPSFDSTQIWPL